MEQTTYHKRIISYYTETEHAYRDSWDLDRSLAIHYGYRDQKSKNFRASLKRMNEVMMETAAITGNDRVLDAGCGVGGSSIFLAQRTGCRVTGITLSARQAEQAMTFAGERGVQHLVDFNVIDYCNTGLPANSFDVVWGCESVCYAHSKEAFIKEAYRLLKPGGRLIIADGFISQPGNNGHPYIRRWLDGWQVNHLVTPSQFTGAMEAVGFTGVAHTDITKNVKHSAKRLYRFYFLARLYLIWKKINFSGPPTPMQKANIDACKYQYLAMKKGLWEYGLMVGRK